jgi:uncharacterized protein involved in exopolysaccharide biosynthesis
MGVRAEALNRAAEALERAGMHDQAHQLREQAEHARKEMEEAGHREPRRFEGREEGAVIHPGREGNVLRFRGEGPLELHRSIKELHEQVQALRKEVAEIRELLQRK